MTEVDGEALTTTEKDPDPRSPSPDTSAESAQQRRILFYSVMAGLCPLIPVPFVDDIVLGYVRKRFLRGIFRDKSLTLSDDQLDVLVREESGCFLGCLGAVVLYPIKKIFRKVFFFLSIKDCVDVASKMFHTGYLLQHAIEVGHLGEASLKGGAGSAMEPFKVAFEKTLEEVDTRPINQILSHLFKGSRRWMRKAARALWQGVREERRSGGDDDAIGEKALAKAGEAQSTQIDAVVDELGSAVWVQSGYLDALRAHFDKRLGEAAGS